MRYFCLNEIINKYISIRKMILFYGLTNFVIDFIYVVNTTLPYLTELLDDDYNKCSLRSPNENCFI